MRQVHPVVIELLGAAEPQAGVGGIACCADIRDAIGVLDRTILELNTLGDGASRQAYRAALVEYFMGYRDALSEDSWRRLELNPLRVLDSKDAGDRSLLCVATSFYASPNTLFK